MTIHNSQIVGKTSQPDPPGSIGTILVVDDSRVSRRILSAQLARMGLRAVEAASAEQALDICRSDLPDIVISDWMMGGMSGLEFCRALRGLSRDRYAYFIMLTSKSEKAELVRGLENGADDFLTKPVSSDELRGRILAGARIIQMERRLQATNRLVSATLQELQTLYDSVNRDLIEARHLQQSLMRETFRDFGGSDVSLLLRPSGHVGGDLVGFFPINSERVGIFAIDVAGHGIASAMLTARLAGYLTGTSHEQNVALTLTDLGIYDAHPPATVAEMLNQIAIREMRTESYFTFAYADVDLVSGDVALVQAGHPHPAVQHASGQVSFIGNGGLPIGMFPDARYDEVRLTLRPGDRLFLMSDGFTEAAGPDGRLLGPEGLARLMERHAALNGPDYLAALLDDVGRYTAEEYSDDVSGAVFRFHHTKPVEA